MTTRLPGNVSDISLLQVVPRLSGGLARTTLDTAQAVIAAGGAAIVASPGGEALPDLLRLRATHLELPSLDHLLWQRLALPARLAASLRDARVNLVQARSPETGWIAGAVARRLKAKWIATLHQPLLGRGVLNEILERNQSRADFVLAVSELGARAVERRFPQIGERLKVIAPGINLDRFDPALVKVDRLIKLAHDLRLPDGRNVVLCPGRFIEDRGQKTLIEAIARLDRPDVFCLLPGSTGMPTALEKELERAIERAKLNGRVQLGPYVEDMPAAYMLADVVVALGGPGRGFSRAVPEAQAMGRPVVVEEGDGAAEAVQPGVTGWLSAPGDPAALAEALDCALALSPARRGELARIAQDNVRRRYGLADCNAKVLQLYATLAGQAGRDGPPDT